MRRLRPQIEREATWAVGLASLGAVSMYATLPAAILLAVRTIRRKRGGDGSEPAIAVLAFGIAWLSFLIGYPAMRSIVLTSTHALDRQRMWGFVLGLVAMAFVVAALATYLIRCHPERWIARRVAVAGIVAAVTAGFLQAMISVVGLTTLTPACGSASASNAACVGATPWEVVGPALLVGGVWFVISVAGAELGRRQR